MPTPIINPVRYTDPSGYMRTEGDLPDFKYPPKSIPEPEIIAPTLEPPVSNNVCEGPNPSILCKGPTLISTGSVVTEPEYPSSPSISGDDKMMTETSPIWWVEVFFIAHDLMSIPSGSSLPAQLQGRYAQGTVYYENHQNNIGPYTVITGIDITNKTGSTILLSVLLHLL